MSKPKVNNVPVHYGRYTGKPMNKLPKPKGKKKERGMSFAQILAEQERILRDLR